MDAATLAAAQADAKRRYAARSNIVRAREGLLEVWGHSYAFGIGASDTTKRFGALIAAALKLNESNEAVSGTAWSTNSSGASWVKILQYVTQAGRGAVSGSSAPATGNRGFISPRGVHLWMCGINDLQSFGNTTVTQDAIRETLTAALSRWRAGAIFEDTDPTITYSSGWASSAVITDNSGSSFKYSSTNGSTWTITTPADFPGGTIGVGIIAPTGVGNGGTHTALVNGTTTVAKTALSARTGTSTGFVLRILNLPAGVNTIVGTVSGIAGYTAIDYWQWEAPEIDAPLAILLKQPYPTDYSSYGNTAPGPPNNAGVDLLNAAIDAAAAQFGSRVLVVDLSSLAGDATNFNSTDHLHPSDKGHRAIAKLVLAAIDSAGFVIQAASALKPRYVYGTAAPTDSRTYWDLGAYMENTAPAELGAAGSKYYINGWKCVAAGRPATWVQDRRLTGN